MRRLLAATACSTALTLAVVGAAAWQIWVAQPMLIMPPWWMLPAYAVLRAVPTKMMGVTAAVAAIFAFFMTPWIVLASAKRRLYRPVALLAAAAFVLAVFVLGFSGAHDPEATVFAGAPGPVLLDSNLNTQLWLGRIATAYYFAYTIAIVPGLGWRRKPDTAAVFA